MRKITTLLLFVTLAAFIAIPCADAMTSDFGGHVTDIKIDAEDEEWDLENFFIRLDDMSDVAYGYKEVALLIETRGRYPGQDCERDNRNLHTCGSSPEYTLEIIYGDEVEETLTELSHHGCEDIMNSFDNKGFTCNPRRIFNEGKFKNTKVVITRRGTDKPLGPADSTWRYVDWKSLELPLGLCKTKKTGNADVDGELACKAINFCQGALNDCLEWDGSGDWQFLRSESSPTLSLIKLDMNAFNPFEHFADLEYVFRTAFDWAGTSSPDRFYMQTKVGSNDFAKRGRVNCKIVDSDLECRAKLEVRKEWVKDGRIGNMEMRVAAMGGHTVWISKPINLTNCEDKRQSTHGIDVCKPVMMIAPIQMEAQVPMVPTDDKGDESQAETDQQPPVIEAEDEEPETGEQPPTLKALEPHPGKGK